MNLGKLGQQKNPERPGNQANPGYLFRSVPTFEVVSRVARIAR
jgi:hypothetical protein